MIRVVFSFFVVINVIVALWVNASQVVSNQAVISRDAPRIQGDDLILIEEIDLSQLSSREAVAAKESAVQGVSAEVEQVDSPSECMLLTSFEFRNEAEALADQIRSLGVDVEMIAEKIESQGPVMVYIKPFISAQEAQRELRVLRASQIDSFIISDGELTNGISLGVFRTEQNALAQEVKIEALGYDVETSYISVQKDRFSLIASGEILDALEDDYWLKIANENKDISIEQKVCNEVASGVNFQ